MVAVVVGVLVAVVVGVEVAVVVGVVVNVVVAVVVGVVGKLTHTPLAHSCLVPHGWLQAPQCAVDESKWVSQPTTAVQSA